MEQTIERIMEVAGAIFMIWTAFMFAKAMRLASYHPEVMNEKADSKE